MLEKKITFYHSVTEAGHIQVRQITRIFEDGKELSMSCHNHVIDPGQDTVGQDERTVKIAKAVHTPEVVAEYKAFVESNKV